jgi:hypothetical protein
MSTLAHEGLNQGAYGDATRIIRASDLRLDMSWSLLNRNRWSRPSPQQKACTALGEFEFVHICGCSRLHCHARIFLASLALAMAGVMATSCVCRCIHRCTFSKAAAWTTKRQDEIAAVALHNTANKHEGRSGIKRCRAHSYDSLDFTRIVFCGICLDEEIPPPL